MDICTQHIKGIICWAGKILLYCDIFSMKCSYVSYFLYSTRIRLLKRFLLFHEQKKKGSFQHSSFLAGGATTAAGRMVVKEGILMVSAKHHIYIVYTCLYVIFFI